MHIRSVYEGLPASFIFCQAFIMTMSHPVWSVRGRSRKGVAGFFEDIPALMIVTISLAIFIIIVLSVFSTYYNAQVYIKMREDGESFSRAVRSYDGLKADYWSRAGVFDSKKLISASAENISRDLHTSYRFSIEVEDVSEYQTKYSTKIISGLEFATSTKITVTSGANIYVSDTELHCARLRVSIWGGQT